MVLLSQSQVLCKKLRLLSGVIGETREVEVGQWSAWEQVSGKHLTNGLDVEAKACDTELRTEEESEEEGEA